MADVKMIMITIITMEGKVEQGMEELLHCMKV